MLDYENRYPSGDANVHLTTWNANVQANGGIGANIKLEANLRANSYNDQHADYTELNVYHKQNDRRTKLRSSALIPNEGGFNIALVDNTLERVEHQRMHNGILSNI